MILCITFHEFESHAPRSCNKSVDIISPLDKWYKGFQKRNSVRHERNDNAYQFHNNDKAKEGNGGNDKDF